MMVSETEMMFAADMRRDLVDRLARLEGQVRGLQRLIDRGNECRQVLIQFLAVRAALEAVGALIVDAEIDRCLGPSSADEGGAELRSNLRLLLRVGQ